ncbi:glycosyltransferase involved in cell wall biosynthesis [Rhizobium sp. SG_E_25_P2]|uniref:glycosyltransferase family 4 protein n=1 Tax=Rhizobium sp. SG_E_25_P2 TaxID=2879942 RepID=UPI002473A884|nr:glycosyltransferase family 4 protein [Rhizobium sp. SG_E_25_P2]MDH6266339.1 glycosyltransferase involved in cell wall biosynthesis [Rhizobium sp. SG_E_25_P2]
MKIAFYAPLKPVDHPVPSGDRLMAQLLLTALEKLGHRVSVASPLRAYLKEPDAETYADLLQRASAERDRLAEIWRESGPPDLFFCYHPYYKSPDMLGPFLCQEFGMPYVTAESSYSARRNIGIWAASQTLARDGVDLAAVNICFTSRDRQGLTNISPAAVTAMLPPFLDPRPPLVVTKTPERGRLLTAAMMRDGNKLESYLMLAAALHQLGDLDWRLDVVGDGPMRHVIEDTFAPFPPGRVVFHGLKSREDLAEMMARASIFLWPGCREAYGLTYLEAQAAGLPVVAQNDGGVPEVVIGNQTGLLTEPGDLRSYASAIRLLLTDETKRMALANGAARFAREERSFETACARLGRILETHVCKA